MAETRAELQTYEAKLERVMERLGVEKFDYDWTRRECWIEFWYRGQLYKFVHSVANAQAHGIDISSMVPMYLRRWFYPWRTSRAWWSVASMTLSVWVAGMKYLPEAQNIPSCFVAMQFQVIPENANTVQERYRKLAKVAHPDTGGSAEQFEALQKAYRQAMEYFVERGDQT